MAVTFTTIKNTNQETVIHFSSTAIETGTIALNTLAASSQELVSGGTPTVNIVRLITTGEDTASLTVLRNNKLIVACAPENAPVLDLTQFGISDNQNNTYDIVVSNNVAKAVTGYIVLRKLAGWATKFEAATYGAYDDPTRVGAATNVPGSPDYTG